MFRSLIFVPGNSTRFVEKAKTLQADIICLDLEDSVPANEKGAARKIIADAISRRQEYGRPVYVRTNSPESGLVAADLKAAVRRGIDGIVVPKVNDAAEIMKIKRQVAALEKQNKTGKIALMPSIETAKGVVNAHQIAGADDGINALVFGVFDFLYDMQLDYDENDPAGYAYARAKVPVDARAAGVHAIDAIWQKIDDAEGLVRDATVAKRLGYSGKSIIHPSQIEPVHRVFLPSNIEVEWAKKVVAALGEAMEKGSGRGAVRLEGRMIDAVHYKQAKAILGAADK
ncbi:MAG TPA: CoA ester lyase [Nitrososphaera sp.]|nr:CoA ester lyase [Nitrososphaera sp.]